VFIYTILQQSAISFVRPIREWGKQVKREESVALLRELGANQLVSPTVVSIEHRLPDAYLLKIKGDYDLQEMKIFLKNKFTVGENKDYLVISEL
jgi:hypothetical protein